MSGHRSKSPTSIRYLDVAEHPEYEPVDMRSPELEARLEEAGFSTLGMIMALPADAGSNPYRGVDAKEFDGYMTQGASNAAMASPDARAFAEPEFGHGAHMLRFRTLLDSGDVVETRMIPARAPDLNCCEGEDDCEAAGRLLEWLQGDEEQSTCPHLPRQGLWRKNSREQDPFALWGLHNEWLDEVVRRRGAAVVEHNSMPLFLSVTRRAWHVQELHANVTGALFWIFQGLWLIVAYGLVIAAGVAAGLGIGFVVPVVVSTIAAQWLLQHIGAPCPTLLAANGVWLACAVVGSQPSGVVVVVVVSTLLAGVLKELLAALCHLRLSSPLSALLPFPGRVAASRLLEVYSEYGQDACAHASPDAVAAPLA